MIAPTTQFVYCRQYRGKGAKEGKAAIGDDAHIAPLCGTCAEILIAHYE